MMSSFLWELSQQLQIKILPDILEWQQRPLESVYPVMWLDAMHFKVREHGKVVTKAVYNILGVNRDGEKQVLGIYFGDNESSSFWRSILHELQQRGVRDIFVACIDNLSGFADAIEDLFPNTDVQLCLVHQMRNSMKYANNADVRPLVKDLKKIYTALMNRRHLNIYCKLKQNGVRNME